MSKKRFFNDEHRGFLNSVRQVFFIQANAEEITDPAGDGGTDTKSNPTPAPTPAPINFEQLIAAARKEEKEKLYPEIKKLKSDLAKAQEDLQKQVQYSNDLLLKNGALQEALEKRQNEKDPTIQTLEAEKERLEQEIRTLKENTPNVEELRSQLEKEFEVKLYRQQQVDANKGAIISLLVDGITGTTKEEIDASIATAVEKTKAIREELGLTDTPSPNNPTPQVNTPTPQQTFQNPPISNPSVSGNMGKYTPDYIRGLDPTSPEYKEFRKSLGLK